MPLRSSALSLLGERRKRLKQARFLLLPPLLLGLRSGRYGSPPQIRFLQGSRRPGMSYPLLDLFRIALVAFFALRAAVDAARLAFVAMASSGSS